MCGQCNKPFVVDKKKLDFSCPVCGQKGTELIRGREFTVKSIEIE